MTTLRSFAPQAARDVEAAAEWIADNAGGPDVARRMVQAVLEAAGRVEHGLGLGGHGRTFFQRRSGQWQGFRLMPRSA